MKRFKKILFLADESNGEKTALARAAAIASANKAKIVILGAVDSDGLAYSDPGISSVLETFLRSRADLRRKELEALRKGVSQKHKGLRISVDVVVGDLARSAIDAVRAKRHDLVVKAAEGGGKRSLLFGSADRTLMRLCPCPVWIMKPTKHRKIKTILAAIDLTPSEDQTDSLAREITSLATSLAKAERADLHIVHAWRLPGETKLRGRQIYATRVDRLVEELREAHRGELDRLLKRYPYEKRTSHLLKGRAADLIAQAAGQLDADLLVIGTVGRTGVPGLIVGNTAEAVLSSVDCSVLTLKPEGFASPIQA